MRKRAKKPITLMRESTDKKRAKSMAAGQSWNFKRAERVGVWETPKPADLKSSTNGGQRKDNALIIDEDEANQIRAELGLPPL